MVYFDTNVVVYALCQNVDNIKQKELASLYQSSFDIFHLAFCEYYESRLITFDKGFKKLSSVAKAQLDIR